MLSSILVTPRSVPRTGHPALERLEAAGFTVNLFAPVRLPTTDELTAMLPGCTGYLAGTESITAEVLDAGKDLKVISRSGSGIDNIDLAAAEARGIQVLRAEGANARGVAELTIGLLFALIRQIPQCDREMKAGTWQRVKRIEIKDRTLGLIGCGKIGRLVAEMGLGLGMKVIAHTRHPDPTFKPKDDFRYGSFDEVLTTADILSLHCPPESKQPLIDADAIQRMQAGAYLINTARGVLLDERAVLKALDTGHLAGAALDTFPVEPPGKQPLIQHPNVIATPHVGSFTSESVNRMVETAVDNLLKVLT